MKRFLFHLLAAACLFFSGLSLALWSPTPRTFSLTDGSERFYIYAGHEAQGRDRLSLCLTHTYSQPVEGPLVINGRTPAEVEWFRTHQPYFLARLPSVFELSAGPFIDDPGPRLAVTGNRADLSLTYWPIISLPFLLALYLYHLLYFRRPNKPGLCPTCGYDLRATPTQCPECGSPTVTG